MDKAKARQIIEQVKDLLIKEFPSAKVHLHHAFSDRSMSFNAKIDFHLMHKLFQPYIKNIKDKAKRKEPGQVDTASLIQRANIANRKNTLIMSRHLYNNFSLQGSTESKLRKLLEENGIIIHNYDFFIDNHFVNTSDQTYIALLTNSTNGATLEPFSVIFYMDYVMTNPN